MRGEGGSVIKCPNPECQENGGKIYNQFPDDEETDEYFDCKLCGGSQLVDENDPQVKKDIKFWKEIEKEEAKALAEQVKKQKEHDAFVERKKKEGEAKRLERKKNNEKPSIEEAMKMVGESMVAEEGETLEDQATRVFKSRGAPQGAINDLLNHLNGGKNR